MFLGEVHGTVVRFTYFHTEIFDKEEADVETLGEQFHENCQRELGNDAVFQRHGCRLVYLIRKIGSETKEFNRFDDTDNLALPTNTLFVYLHFSRYETKCIFGSTLVLVDDFVLLILLDFQMFFQ